MSIKIEEDFVEVTFGARSVRFYPLDLGWLRKNAHALEGLRKGTGGNLSALDADKMEMLGKILHASATRGNPSVTQEDVDAVIDVKNIFKVMGGVFNMSGFRQVPAEQADDPTSPRTGGESTQE
jgi:hypothetical protein